DARVAQRGRALDGGVHPQVLDEVVDPLVVVVVDLELVAPRLERDRLVQALVRAQHRLLDAAHLAGELVDLVLRQARAVGDPDRAVLKTVHRVLAGDRGVVDVTHAVLPGRVVHAADGRRVLVGERAGLVRLVLQAVRIGLAVVDDAVDRVRPLVPRLGALERRPGAVADDAGGQHAHGHEERDRAPGPALAHLDRGDRL